MIAALILAAGQSRRMGQPKMLLPWGKSTVIGHVLTTFLDAGVKEIVVVTGGARNPVEELAKSFPVQIVFNKDFATGEMLSSLQIGLQSMANWVEATLIGLGDQPQVQERSVRSICQAYREYRSNLVVPSFQMKRGHPWLVARPLWGELLEMRPPQSPRDFLNKHGGKIHYVNMDTPSVLADLDTPEDYEKFHP